MTGAHLPLKTTGALHQEMIGAETTTTTALAREASPATTALAREARDPTEATASLAKEDTTRLLMTGAPPLMTGAHQSLSGNQDTGVLSLSLFQKTMMTGVMTTTTVERVASPAPTEAREESLDLTDTVEREESLEDTTAVGAHVTVVREESPDPMVVKGASPAPMDLASRAKGVTTRLTMTGALLMMTGVHLHLKMTGVHLLGAHLHLKMTMTGVLLILEREASLDPTEVREERVDTVSSVEMPRKVNVTSPGVDGQWMTMMTGVMTTTTVERVASPAPTEAREESLDLTDTVEREASLEDITAVAAHVSLMNLMSTSTRPTTPTHISQNQMMITRLLRASLARDHTEDMDQASLARDHTEDMDQASLARDHTEDMDQASLARDHTHQVMTTDGLVMVTSTTNQFVKNLLH